MIHHAMIQQQHCIAIHVCHTETRVIAQFQVSKEDAKNALSAHMVDAVSITVFSLE